MALTTSTQCRPLRRRLRTFWALRFSVKFSEEVARTRRWSSSRPIRPSVKLKIFSSQRLDSHLSKFATYPAKTPPARTSAILIVRWYQNSGDPRSVPPFPAVTELKGRRYGDAIVVLTSSIHKASPFLLTAAIELNGWSFKGGQGQGKQWGRNGASRFYLRW